MARTPASDGMDGVGKSGSPAPRSITSSPAALRRFASCEIAIVAEVSRCCRLGDRPDAGVMRGRIAPRGEVGNRDYIPRPKPGPGHDRSLGPATIDVGAQHAAPLRRPL